MTYSPDLILASGGRAFEVAQGRPKSLNEVLQPI
jgi:hypothetical protein